VTIYHPVNEYPYREDPPEETPTREWLMKRLAFYASECERQGDIIERYQSGEAPPSAAELDRVRVLEQAIGNCYMMARRQIAAHLNGTSTPQKDLERWQHIQRFCETTGSKSSILRGQLPTEITNGSIDMNCTCGFSLPCPAHGMDDISPK
jgi:hypothetical protein